MAARDGGCGGCILPLVFLAIGEAVGGPAGAMIGLFIGLAVSSARPVPGEPPATGPRPQLPKRPSVPAPAPSGGENVPAFTTDLYGSSRARGRSFFSGAGRSRAARPSEVGKVCPYCITTIGRSARVVECPGCGRVYHADCWQDNGGCAVYGCRVRA